MKKPKPSGSDPQAQFVKSRKAFSDALIEREDEVDLILTALLCREHPLLVGPPGTAKSMLLDLVMKWIDGDLTRFSVLVNKFTTPEEIFGPISLSGLKADVYRRITTGKLPESHISFIDEIFKASTAILNTMLRILNEREYDNGTGKFTKCPLLLCVAASNEWPNSQDGGKELGALFDRFLFRKTVRTIRSEQGLHRLLWEPLEAKIPHIELTEVESACDAVDDVTWSDESQQAFMQIVSELRKDGIVAGDRRLRKSVKACQAFAYLDDCEEVEVEHLDILSHTLWDDPAEQPDRTAKIVGRIANPIGTFVVDQLMQASDVLAKNSPTDAVPKLKNIQQALKKRMEQRPDKPNARLEGAVIEVSNLLKKTYDKVVGL